MLILSAASETICSAVMHWLRVIAISSDICFTESSTPATCMRSWTVAALVCACGGWAAKTMPCWAGAGAICVGCIGIVGCIGCIGCIGLVWATGCCCCDIKFFNVSASSAWPLAMLCTSSESRGLPLILGQSRAMWSLSPQLKQVRGLLQGCPKGWPPCCCIMYGCICWGCICCIIIGCCIIEFAPGCSIMPMEL